MTMANTYRGEIAAEIGGKRRTLVLTLGALAELESAFGASDLMALAEPTLIVTPPRPSKPS